MCQKFQKMKLINQIITHKYWLLMRLNRPIGWLLLLWPTWVALWIASHGQPSLKLFFIFTLGVIVMRSAGCVVNDLADKKWDGQVARTEHRPLVTTQPENRVSVKSAVILFLVLIILAFLLVLQTNLLTIKLSFIAIFLAILYPFTKRFTYYPQFFLGAAYGMAIPMVFAATQNQLPVVCGVLYLAVLIWAVAYDTEYAMVDKSDDLRVGIKSTAIVFGQWDKAGISLAHTVVLINLSGVGYLSGMGSIYYVGLVGALISALYQQWLIRNREPAMCFKAFLNNNYFGLCCFLGTVLNY
jgi:4-hydroxybenzoate polyprenyltransferase